MPSFHRESSYHFNCAIIYFKVSIPHIHHKGRMLQVGNKLGGVRSVFCHILFVWSLYSCLFSLFSLQQQGIYVYKSALYSLGLLEKKSNVVRFAAQRQKLAVLKQYEISLVQSHSSVSPTHLLPSLRVRHYLGFFLVFL